jgi:hypothetical protein
MICLALTNTGCTTRAECSLAMRDSAGWYF